MPPKNPPIPTHAPPAIAPANLRVPAAGRPPDVDVHVVRPGTRDEMIRGRLVYALPALEPHGDAHGELGFAVRGFVRPGYIVSTDLLTRLSRGSDFATDTCIRKAGIDPTTNHRYLEELAFEIVFTQKPREIAERAEDLSARGVRRVFAIFVKKRKIAEWSPAHNGWRPLPPDGSIEDTCLVAPLPVRALLEAAENENAVARALLVKKNPTLERARQDAWRGGQREGRIEGIVMLCQALGIALTAEGRAMLDRMDGAELKELMEAMARRRSWPLG
jgi:hypothetical protein